MSALPYHPSLDVYRNAEGQPITFTEQQCAALRHNLRVWHAIRVESGYYDRNPYLMGEDGVVKALALRATSSPADMWGPFSSAEIAKSRLLGRLLYEGRPPLAERPPVVFAEPRYDLVVGNEGTP